MSKFTKIFVGGFIIIMGGLILSALIMSRTEKQVSTGNIEQNITPLRSYNITVRSEIVKKINDVYRYFFFITNNNSHPFDATIEIGLLETNGIQIAFDEFTPKPPIQPQMSRYCYVDAKWGPPGITQNAVEKFAWQIIVNGQITQKGIGDITSKFEDASD